MAQIHLIACVDNTNAIGREGKLLFNIKADMQRFREKTDGKDILAGRDTMDEIGKPLENRRVYMATKTEFGRSLAIKRECHATTQDPTGFIIDRVLDEKAPDLYVIGGAQIFKLAIQYADIIHLTKVNDAIHNADAYFPVLSPKEWVIRHREAPTGEDGVEFQFISLMRK